MQKGRHEGPPQTTPAQRAIIVLVVACALAALIVLAVSLGQSSGYTVGG